MAVSSPSSQDGLFHGRANDLQRAAESVRVVVVRGNDGTQPKSSPRQFSGVHARTAYTLCCARGMCRNLRKGHSFCTVTQCWLQVSQSMLHRQWGEILNVGVEADSPQCWTQFNVPSYRYLSVWADWNLYPFFGGQKQMGCRNCALCNSTAHWTFIFNFLTSFYSERAASKLIWCWRWQLLTAPPPHCCLFFFFHTHCWHALPQTVALSLRVHFPVLSLSHGRTTALKGLPPLTQIQSSWFFWKRMTSLPPLDPDLSQPGVNGDVKYSLDSKKSFVSHTLLKIVKHLQLLVCISPSQFMAQLAKRLTCQVVTQT